MKVEEEWKIAFRTRYKLYEYTMMPFGLTNASTTCQEMINDALRQHLDQFVIAYLNDIMIYSKILKEHVNHVSKVLECLDMRNLHLKSKKCEFHQEEVDFLEFVVGRHGVRMDPKKLRAIKEWKSPINVKEVQFFLGFINYNRKFIRDYFAKAISLTNLTKKDTPWTWRPIEEKSF